MHCFHAASQHPHSVDMLKKATADQALTSSLPGKLRYCLTHFSLAMKTLLLKLILQPIRTYCTQLFMSLRQSLQDFSVSATAKSEIMIITINCSCLSPHVCQHFYNLYNNSHIHCSIKGVYNHMLAYVSYSDTSAQARYLVLLTNHQECSGSSCSSGGVLVIGKWPA